MASTVSGRSAGMRSAGSSHSVELPDLPWSDWEIKASDIVISKDSHDEPLKLGSGAYGTVWITDVTSRNISNGFCPCFCEKTPASM